MPSTIKDYRNPAIRSGHYRTYGQGYRNQKGNRRFWMKMPATHVVLTKDGGLLVYYYGDYNTIPWSEVMSVAQSELDKSLQDDIHAIAVKGTGYLLARSREFASWSGDRNRYSTDVVDVVRALYERGGATLAMPIWLGLWAANAGEHIGTVRSILANVEIPSQITLFHGTDTLRLAQITKSGLKPMAFDDRVWNNSSLDKVRPVHRENSIYLTASRPQAEYYASKTVNVDRKRFGPTKRREAERIASEAERHLDQYTARLASYDRMTPEQIASQDEHTKRYFDRSRMTIADERQFLPGQMEKARKLIDQAKQYLARDFYGKIEPVILQITLHKGEYGKLMADDDFLKQHPESDPQDWHKSLSVFGQIAYRGEIPPTRIKIISQGATTQRAR